MHVYELKAQQYHVFIKFIASVWVKNIYLLNCEGQVFLRICLQFSLRMHYMLFAVIDLSVNTRALESLYEWSVLRLETVLGLSNASVPCTDGHK